MIKFRRIVFPTVACLATLTAGCASLRQENDPVGYQSQTRPNTRVVVTGSNIKRSASPVRVIQNRGLKKTHGATAQDVITGGKREL